MISESLNLETVLNRAEAGVSSYLNTALEDGSINQSQFNAATANVIPTLRAWLHDPEIDRISPNLKAGVADAVDAGRWEDIVNAYRKACSFGTGGIRGMMAFDRSAIVKLKEDGIDARILKGPNTINNVVLLRTSAGVARFGKDGGRSFDRIVIGYDSRVRGGDFARAIAELFLAYGYTIYLFDEPCPYPMVTFAIPFKEIKAHVGILISASHNDYRYNGYKLSCGNGSQFDPRERDEMYENYIVPATFADVKLKALGEAPEGKLWWLGGAEPLPDIDYCGREKNLINIHKAHCDHVKHFLMTLDLAAEERTAGENHLKIAFCAYHGAGRKAVPRMLTEVGLPDIKSIHHNGLFDLNGLFPSFCSEPGKEQQPDPGDPRAAKIAVDAFNAEYPGEFGNIDIMIGTDPDADRCGMVVKVPEAQRSLFGGRDWTLLPADDMWAILIWYRLQMEIEKFGTVPDADKKFLVLSHTTTDAIVRLCRKYGVGVVRTIVGFAALSAAVRDQWQGAPRPKLVEGREKPGDALCHPYVIEYIDMTDARGFNIGSLEQSNGFSLLGGPPPDQFSLGVDGHVRDKDGIFAAILSAEVAAWAKRNGTTLFDLVDEKVYLDPDIGLFVNHYEPDPLDGEYPGIEGDRKKIGILQKALDLFARAQKGEKVVIGGLPSVSTVMYRTGKYDRLYPPSGDFVFPDEGVRFYFDKDKLSHLTVRPSGTGNSLRFHVQLHSDVTRDNLLEKKSTLRAQAVAVADDIRAKLGAPR
jgi:phosphoglucomutase